MRKLIWREFKPGNIAIGDFDGIFIVPGNVVEDVFSHTIEKARGEKMVYKKIMDGMSTKGV